MIVCPILTLIYDRIFFAESWHKLFKARKSYYVSLALTWGILAGVIYSQSAQYAEGQTKMPSRWEYLMTESQVIMRYLSLTFWPANLCFEYNWPVVKQFQTVYKEFILLSVLFLATLLAFFKYPKWPFADSGFF